jgi:hypothetical protein
MPVHFQSMFLLGRLHFQLVTFYLITPPFPYSYIFTIMSIAKTISMRMAELGIKSNVELADKMGGIVRPQTIGKWKAEKTTPRGKNLIVLAKALKMSVDLLVLDEGDNPDQTKSLERMVSQIVKSEIQKTPVKSNNEFEEMMKSDKIPEEEKDLILRHIRNLLKLYQKNQ